MSYISSVQLKTQLPSGRYIYRHSSGLGSVLEFKMFGNPVKLFVPDAQYRPNNTVEWGLYGTDIGNVNISYNDFYPNGSAFSQTSPIDFTMTDTKLDTQLASWKSDGSAKSNTNNMISDIGSDTSNAAGLARSVQISGLGAMDLPNLYELYVCWLESDNIDAIDPTASAYKQNLLGYRQGNRFKESYYWSSSEYNSYHAWYVGYTGGVYYYYKYNSYYVLPVLEL